MPKFSPKNFPINLKLTTKLNKIAAKRSMPVTPAQLALAYVLQMSDKIIPIPGSSHIKRTLESAFVLKFLHPLSELSDS